MTAAANLDEAADIANSNLLTLWIADSLRSDCIAFAAAANLIFQEQDVKTHPASNWVAVIAAAAPGIQDLDNISAGVGRGTVNPFTQMVGYVYRLCKLANALNLQTPQQITNAQATALLAAYNTNFA